MKMLYYVFTSVLCISSLAISDDISQLVANLSDNKWQIREKATISLLNMGINIKWQLLIIQKKPHSIDVRLRLERILRYIDAGIDGDLYQRIGGAWDHFLQDSDYKHWLEYFVNKGKGYAVPFLRKILVDPCFKKYHVEIAKALEKLEERTGIEALISHYEGASSLTLEDQINLADLYRKLRMFDKAEKELNKAIGNAKEDHKKAWVYAVLGLTYYQNFMYTEAEKVLEQAIRLSPDYSYARYLLSYTFWVRGRFEEAIKACREILKYDSMYLHAHYLISSYLRSQRRYEDARKELREAYSKDISNFDTHMEIAEIYLYEDDYENTEKHLNQLIYSEPNCARIYVNLALVALRREEWDVSIKEARRALSIDSRDKYALIYLAEAYRNKDKLKEAEKYFLDVLSIDSENVSAHDGLARIYQKKGDKEKAEFYIKWVEDHYQKYISFQPLLASNYNDLAWFYTEIEINLDKGIDLSLHSLTLSPNDPNFMDTLAVLYYKKGEYEKAIITIQKAIQTKPKNIFYYRKQLDKFQRAFEKLQSKKSK